MILKKLFGKKQDHSDYGKLMAGMIFLSKKTEEYFGPDDFEKLNPMELGIFFGAFNSACYVLINENVSKPDLNKFTQYIAKMIVENVLDKNKISNTPDIEIKDFIATISQHYSKRCAEYLGLLEKEAQKPRGSGSFVDITCGILNNLYETKLAAEERYDPLFAALLSNHISVFTGLLRKKFS